MVLKGQTQNCLSLTQTSYKSIVNLISILHDLISQFWNSKNLNCIIHSYILKWPSVSSEISMKWMSPKENDSRSWICLALLNKFDNPQFCYWFKVRDPWNEYREERFRLCPEVLCSASFEKNYNYSHFKRAYSYHSEQLSKITLLSRRAF